MTAERSPEVSSLVVVGCQWAPGSDRAANRASISTLVGEAVALGADLVVFPEYAQYWDGPPSTTWHSQAEDLSGDFVEHLSSLSSAHGGIALVAGMIERHEGGKPFNTLVAIADGQLVGRSRKIHLYDAFSARESVAIDPAPQEDPSVFWVRGVRIGLQTCYDLRFPEVTRRLVDAGAQVVVIPAQWVPGPNKTFQWQTLLRARAIESQLFVVAVDHPAPQGVGASMIVGPDGRDLLSLDEEPGLVSAPLSLERIDEVRRVNPMASLRRFTVQWT